jgi:hypothetical protein
LAGLCHGVAGDTTGAGVGLALSDSFLIPNAFSSHDLTPRLCTGHKAAAVAEVD